jgi:hypothetical protein
MGEIPTTNKFWKSLNWKLPRKRIRNILFEREFFFHSNHLVFANPNTPKVDGIASPEIDGYSLNGSSLSSETALHKIGRFVGDAPRWLDRIVRPIVNFNLWIHTRSAFLSGGG